MIIKAFKGNVYSLSTHEYGHLSINILLEYTLTEKTSEILDELQKRTKELIKNKCGRYVINCVLDQGRPDDQNDIINIMKDRFLEMSCHIYGSTVMTKAITYASPEDRQIFINKALQVSNNIKINRNTKTIITCNGGNHTDISEESVLNFMMNDPHAIYVVQKMKDVAVKNNRDVRPTKRPGTDPIVTMSTRRKTESKSVHTRIKVSYNYLFNYVGPMG